MVMMSQSGSGSNCGGNNEIVGVVSRISGSVLEMDPVAAHDARGYFHDFAPDDNGLAVKICALLKISPTE